MLKNLVRLAAASSLAPLAMQAGDADIIIPNLHRIEFRTFSGDIQGVHLLYLGLIVCVIGAVFGFLQYRQLLKVPVHETMSNVSSIIWETCKTYLQQQSRFLTTLWVLIGACLTYYFLSLQEHTFLQVLLILICSVLGIIGSYAVAWFGIRMNTQANSRTAFAAMRWLALPTLTIPLRSGMSVGMLLVSVELFFMICILAFLPGNLVGPCFIAFAIGQSLGASALRICGGIFAKIADIGADLVKTAFNLPKDDPKNPGVIADCTGDNTGDSVGSTSDSFETYGVTGVALVAFLALALADTPYRCGQLIIWLFTMRVLMIVTSLVSFTLNERLTEARFGKKGDFDFEAPLTSLVWITSGVSILATFAVSFFLLGQLTNQGQLWWVLSTIISCGTLAGAVIPQFTKAFTSTRSRHVQEVVNASRHGSVSLNILSGFVAGNFSAFWKGLTILVLMLAAALLAQHSAITGIMPGQYSFAGPIFAFGLLAFGFLSMGPVTIAVDSFGPVTDNAQSIYKLSRVESVPEASANIKERYGFEPDFPHATQRLAKADGAANTFKATTKPLLIGTAVVGATTLIFGIILLLDHLYGNAVDKLSIVQPEMMLGLLMGGSVIYWFTGASTQAVVTGAYRAAAFIKNNLRLDQNASAADSKEVVRLCTLYAQKGMLNIFIVLFCLALALPFFNPFFFVGYLIALAFFGLFQAFFLANAGSAWASAHKILESELRPEKTTSQVGDMVGDPFKDTASVSLNPAIKFTTLFGLLTVQIAVTMESTPVKMIIGSIFTLLALFFVYRSFYEMRIPEEPAKPIEPPAPTAPPVLPV